MFALLCASARRGARTAHRGAVTSDRGAPFAEAPLSASFLPKAPPDRAEHIVPNRMPKEALSLFPALSLATRPRYPRATKDFTRPTPRAKTRGLAAYTMRRHGARRRRMSASRRRREF